MQLDFQAEASLKLHFFTQKWDSLNGGWGGDGEAGRREHQCNHLPMPAVYLWHHTDDFEEHPHSCTIAAKSLLCSLTWQITVLKQSLTPKRRPLGINLKWKRRISLVHVESSTSLMLLGKEGLSYGNKRGDPWEWGLGHSQSFILIWHCKAWLTQVFLEAELTLRALTPSVNNHYYWP